MNFKLQASHIFIKFLFLLSNNMLRLFRWLPHFKGKLRLGKVLFKRRINKNRAFEFTAHGNVKYKIPNTLESLGVELLITGIYEKRVVKFLKNEMKQGDIYFDIGANIGSLALPVLKNKVNIKYFGFEASPMVFDYLKYNFIKNNMKGYQLHNYLVHEFDNQSMKFYESVQYGKSSLAPTYSTSHVLVNSIALDTFCNNHPVTKINWMKVDVQGFELFVFKGMQQLLLNKKVDNIIFEFEYWAEEAAGLEKGAAQKYLAALGYELFDLNGKRLSAVLTTGRAMVWARQSK